MMTTKKKKKMRRRTENEMTRLKTDSTMMSDADDEKE